MWYFLVGSETVKFLEKIHNRGTSPEVLDTKLFYRKQKHCISSKITFRNVIIALVSGAI